MLLDENLDENLDDQIKKNMLVDEILKFSS